MKKILRPAFVFLGMIALFGELSSLDAQNGIFNIGYPSTTVTVPSAIKGASYKLYFAVEDGVAPFTVDVSGTLPSGLSFAQTQFRGNVLGEPSYIASTYLEFSGTVATTAGAFANRATITVTDSSPTPQTLTTRVDIFVTDSPTIQTFDPWFYPQYENNILRYAVTGQQYGTTINGLGGPGTAGYRWSVEDADPTDPFIGPSTISQIRTTTSFFDVLLSSSGAIPAGLARPERPYLVRVSFWHDDYPTLVDTQEFKIFVVDPLSISTEELPYAFGGESYQATIEGEGGASALELTEEEEEMVTNGTMFVADRNLVWTIEDANPDLAPVGVISSGEDPILEDSGINFASTVSEIGEQPVWQMFTPASFINNQAASLSGTINPNVARPPVSGTRRYLPYEVKVTIAVEGHPEINPVEKTFELHIFPALEVALAVNPLEDATAGEDYELYLISAGGTGIVEDYDWSRTEATLPIGLSVEQDPSDFSWKITGTPDFGLVSPEQTFQVVFTVENEGPREDIIVATQTLALRVVEVQLSSAPVISDLIAGIPFQAPLLLTGLGAAPYLWSVSAGQLPAGLAIEEVSGLWSLQGTPDFSAISNAPYSFTLTVSDSTQPRNYQNLYHFELYVRAPELVILTSNLPAAVVGESYDVELEALGVPDLTWTTSSLPAGLELFVDQTTDRAYIRGVPAIGAAQGQAVQITVADGQTPSTMASVRMLLRVLPNDPLLTIEPLVIQTTALPAATELESYGPIFLVATGGSGSYEWRESVGLPPGIVLESTEGQWSLGGKALDGSAGTWPVLLTARDQVHEELIEQVIFTLVVLPDVITPSNQQVESSAFTPAAFLENGAPAGCALDTKSQPAWFYLIGLSILIATVMRHRQARAGT